MTHALAVDQLQGTPDPVTRIIEPHISDARLQGRRPEADADVGNLLKREWLWPWVTSYDLSSPPSCSITTL